MLRKVLLASVLVFLVGYAEAQPPPLPPIQPDQARLLTTLTSLRQPVVGLVSLSDRGPVLSVTEQGLVQYWTTPQLSAVRFSEHNPATQLALPGIITTATLIPQGLVLGGLDGKLYQVSAYSNSPPQTWAGHQGAIRTLSNAGPTCLVSGGEDGQIVVWEWGSGKPKAKWLAHQDWISALALDEKNNHVASSGYDLVVRLWNLNNGQKVRELPLHPTDQKPAPGTLTTPAVVAPLTFSPDGKFLAGGCLDGTIRLWEPTSGNLLRMLTGHSSRITGLLFHPGGQVLISGSCDRTIRLWNVANGQALRVLEGHQSWVQGLALVEQATRLVSASTDGTIRVWDLRAPPK